MKKDPAKTELLLSDTSVPDVFLVQYAPLLGRDAIVAYLFIRMLYPEGAFSSEDTAQMSFMPSRELQSALAELIENDLLIRSEDSFKMTDLKKREVEEYIKVAIARGGATVTEIPGLSADEQQRNLLADSISKTFYAGRMAYVFHRLIDKCLYEYKFESEVVYRLFEEAADAPGRHHYQIAYMEKKAEEWYKSGYTTMASLSAYLEKKSRVDEMIKRMGKISRKHLDGPDIEMIEKWVHALDVSAELAEFAYRQNSKFRKTVTMKHVEDKLTEWIAADIRTVDKALVYEDERHKENAVKYVGGKRRDNAWKTGKEAGIVKEAKEAGEEKEAKQPEGSPKKTSSKKEEPDDSRVKDAILTLFGDDSDE